MCAKADRTQPVDVLLMAITPVAASMTSTSSRSPSSAQGTRRAIYPALARYISADDGFASCCVVLCVALRCLPLICLCLPSVVIRHALCKIARGTQWVIRSVVNLIILNISLCEVLVCPRSPRSCLAGTCARRVRPTRLR